MNALHKMMFGKIEKVEINVELNGSARPFT